MIIRYLLRKKKATVGDIAGEIKLSFKSTSRHLAVLSGAGILEREQVGLEVFNSLSPDRHTIVSETLKLLQQ